MHTDSRVDLHTHSLLSDGVLLPSEMLRRAEVPGYGALAITDHAESSNVQDVLEALLRLAREGASGFITEQEAQSALVSAPWAMVSKPARPQLHHV